MDPKRELGDFMLEAGKTGHEAVANLARFGNTRKFGITASNVAFISTLLIDTAKMIKLNEQYFKPEFELKFMKIIDFYKEKYTLISAAVEKAKEWKPEVKVQVKEEGEGEGEEVAPENFTLWKRFVWGLGMDPDKTRSWDVDTFLGNDGDRPGYQVLQYAASLIIIQKHAQVRELSPDEKVQLQRLKKGTGWFLDMLRTADIASVMAFSLCDMKPNTVDGLPEPSKASSSTDSESATLCGASVTEVSASTKEEQEPKAEAGPPSAPSFLPPAKTYEMWRISEGGRIVKANNKNIRIFGISLPFKVASSEIVDGTLSTKTPLSDEEITQILADKDTKLSGGDPPRTLDMLSQVSEAAHSIISQLVNDRSKNDRYNWTLKDVSGVPESKRPGWWARRRGERPTNRISHATWIVILEGVEKWRPRPPGWRPAAGPPGPPPPRGPTIVYVDPKPNKQKVKSGTKLKLTQQETENVINDFLASISTLYDDVPIEERATALQSVEIPSGDEYDSDDDSDGSSSTSSGSVADD